MIAFELTMPHRGSWNGQWSDESHRHIRIMPESAVNKDLWDKDFFYSWNDGWTACVSVKKMDARKARQLLNKSTGFCGYDWMIRSLLRDGTILTESERAANA